MIGRRGYILVETVTAMAVLSITAAAVQQALYTAIQARGLARDYTVARILLDQLAAEVDLAPRLADGATESGVFEPPFDRFEYAWYVEQAPLEPPDLPPGPDPAQRAALEAAMKQPMGRVRFEIRWTRAGEPISVSAATLIAPGRLWTDPGGVGE